MRILIYIILAAAFFTPLLASANLVLPRQISETAYFSALIAAAFVLYASALAAKRIALPKVGVLGLAVAVWAITSAALGREFLPLAFGAFFFLLQSPIRHEEEWIRLLRVFVWVGILLSWVAFLGSPGRIFLHAYAPFFTPLFFLALVFAARERPVIARIWFGSAAALFALVLLYAGNVSAVAGFIAGVAVFAGAYAAVYRGKRKLIVTGTLIAVFVVGVFAAVGGWASPVWPWPMEIVSGALRSGAAVWIMKAKTAGFPVAAALALMWMAAFATVWKIAHKNLVTPRWIAGLSGAFAGAVISNPFLAGWPLALVPFFVVAALVEWVAHAEHQPIHN